MNKAKSLLDAKLKGPYMFNVFFCYIHIHIHVPSLQRTLKTIKDVETINDFETIKDIETVEDLETT